MIDFITIGHVSNDLNPYPHLGGSVSYSGTTLKKLGSSVQIMTVLDPDHEYVNQLQKLKIKIKLLPPEKKEYKNKIFTLVLNYDASGNRIIEVKEHPGKMYTDVNGIKYDSNLLICPIINELDYINIIKFHKKTRNLFMVLQGFFRFVENGKIINRRPKYERRFLNLLKMFEIVFVSQEDLSFTGKFDFDFFRQIKNTAKIVVLTRGQKGLEIFQRKKPPIKVQAFKLSRPEIRDFTGAGDCCAAAFIWDYIKNKNLKRAGVFACLYAALKIVAISGQDIGLETVPTIRQLKNFIQKNSYRYSEFLNKNHTYLRI